MKLTRTQTNKIVYSLLCRPEEWTWVPGVSLKHKKSGIYIMDYTTTIVKVYGDGWNVAFSNRTNLYRAYCDVLRSRGQDKDLEKKKQITKQLRNL